MPKANANIDYIGSWGPMILGHGHPAVLEAVHEGGAGRAVSFGAPTEREVELAEEILSRWCRAWRRCAW